MPLRVSRGGAEGAARVEEEERGRKMFKQPRNCHQMGSCPREGDVLAGGGAGEEKSKGRREDFSADYTQTTQRLLLAHPSLGRESREALGVAPIPEGLGLDLSSSPQVSAPQGCPGRLRARALPPHPGQQDPAGPGAHVCGAALLPSPQKTPWRLKTKETEGEGAWC